MASSLLGTFGLFSQSSSKSQAKLKSASKNSSTHSLVFEAPPLSPLQLGGYSPRTKTRVLTAELAEEIRVLLPARNQLYDNWTLVYSLEQHGASLATLYNNSATQISHSGSEERTASRNGYVLVVRDTSNKIFGAYVNEYFHPSTSQGSRRFYGNGDCFLWSSKLVKRSSSFLNTQHVKEKDLIEVDGQQNGPTTLPKEQYDIQFKGFPYTGVNDFVIYCTNQFLSLGGGDGHYGLWLDDSLNRGVSSHSLTFGNEPLSDEGTSFGIIGVEVWKIG